MKGNGAMNNQEVSPMGTRVVISKPGVGAAVAVGVALLFSASPVRAHHAFAAEFDDKRPVHFVDATVTKVEFINPHSWIHVDAKMPDGTVENWAIEAGSPNILMRRGITRETLKAGDKINVDGYQSKDGSHRANGRDLTLPNGQKLFLQSQSASEGAPPNEVPRPGIDTK
jgi:Family of unknown function (DUF6152)